MTTPASLSAAPRLIRVALLSPPYSSLTYEAPRWFPASLLKKGLRVAVPLGQKGLRCAIILDETAPADPKLRDVILRPLWWPLERAPLLDERYLDMIGHLARFQMTTPGRVLGNVLPLGLKTARVFLRVFEPDSSGRPRNISLPELIKCSGPELMHLSGLWEAGQADIQETAAEALDRDICSVAADPPWPLRPQAKRQLAALEYLWDNGPLPRRKLLARLGPGGGETLRVLTARGLVRIGSCQTFGEDDSAPLELPPELPEEIVAPVSLPAKGFEFTPEQKAALDGLNELLISTQKQGHDPPSALLHGITGSGKTAVYLELARRCLKSGRSVLLLAPEVALAWKLMREARTYLPEADLFFAHGYQSAGLRERTFRSLAARRQSNDSPCLVVGTRSSLFLPMPDLGLIVLDEEHDDSFKQDEGLLYQAKDLAYFLAGRDNALLVLGSATPDVRTFHAARQGAIHHYALEERVSGAQLPSLRLIDISSQSPQQGILAAKTLEALRAVVARGEQVVIMLNRRGYAPLMYCLSCGAVATCPHCDIGLTFHKGRERMICHYCGFAEPFPSPCPKCGSLHFLAMTEGTEKLEETLSSALGEHGRVLRLDRDTTRRPGRLEEILAAFGAGEADILVGTQMLSKGHHFPRVTLAVVADADLGLNLPDYRAAERTFQLLLQSAGRAGRGDAPGEVIVQTRTPDHYCWKFLQNNDYVGFFEQEIAKRDVRRYPPFVRLALIRISFPQNWSEGFTALNAVGAAIKEGGRASAVSVLGPAPAPIGLLRGQKRYQCLLKAATWREIRELYAKIGKQIPVNSKLRLSLDLDPVNLL